MAAFEPVRELFQRSTLAAVCPAGLAAGPRASRFGRALCAGAPQLCCEV